VKSRLAGANLWPTSTVVRSFYTSNYPALAFYIWDDSLCRLQSYCWETARLSFSPKFSMHPVEKNYALDRKMIATFLMVSTSSITVQSLRKIVLRAAAVGAKIWCLYFITGGMPQSGKLPVLNLLTGQKPAFSPRRGDSLHRFTWNLARPRNTWVRLAARNFSSQSVHGVGTQPPQYEKCPLFGKESPRRGEPLDRFLKFLWAFILPTILHLCFKFSVIRFTAYGVIAEKPRVGSFRPNFSVHLYKTFSPCRSIALSWQQVSNFV